MASVAVSNAGKGYTSDKCVAPAENSDRQVGGGSLLTGMHCCPTARLYYTPSNRSPREDHSKKASPLALGSDQVSANSCVLQP